MFRIIKLSGVFYARETDDVNHLEIEDLISEGTSVILVDSLFDLEDLGIDPDEVEINQ